MKQIDMFRLVDVLTEPAVVLNVAGQVEHFNWPAVQLLGVSTPGEAPPWQLFELDRTPLDGKLYPAATTCERRVILQGHHATLHDLMVRAVPLAHADGAPSGTLVTFVDAPRDATQDLKEYQRFFELSDDCLCVTTAAGNLVRVNDGATQLLGWSRNELLGTGLARLTHCDDLDRTQVALASQQPLNEFVNRVRHRDGTWRLLSWTMRAERDGQFGDVRYLRAVDVTEKLRREEELVASRELLAEAQDIANIATVARDYRTGALDVAPRLRRMLGVPDGETLEAFLGPRLGADARARLCDALDRGLRGEPTSHRIRVELPRGVREFKGWARPHRDVRGDVVWLAGVVQDVTEEPRLAAQLRLAERMASVGTLAAGVAHEINNPLAFIVANLNAVRADLDRVRDVPGIDFADVKAALAEASEGAERVRDIVAGLRAFTHVDDGALGACDVVHILEAVLNLSRNETRHRARVISRFDPLPTIVANEARLGQVFLNLVLNAAQAIPDGHLDENAITVATHRERDTISVSVSDTGSGIAPDTLPRIFDPFFTTRVDGGGTGLGLFIAQGIVRELNGELLVESAVGVGTTFTIRLPINAPVARPQVLIVDDEPLVAKSLERMLKRYAVTIAASAEDALEHLASAHFDLVLCDLHMPGLGGMGLWARLSPEQRERVVFVTGGGFSAETEAFLQRHAARVLYKPFPGEAVDALFPSLGNQEEGRDRPAERRTR